MTGSVFTRMLLAPVEFLLGKVIDWVVYPLGQQPLVSDDINVHTRTPS